MDSIPSNSFLSICFHETFVSFNQSCSQLVPLPWRFVSSRKEIPLVVIAHPSEDAQVFGLDCRFCYVCFSVRIVIFGYCMLCSCIEHQISICQSIPSNSKFKTQCLHSCAEVSKCILRLCVVFCLWLLNFWVRRCGSKKCIPLQWVRTQNRDGRKAHLLSFLLFHRI